MWDLFKRLSFKVFGKMLEPSVDYFGSLKYDLQQAGIPLSLKEYVYVTIFIITLIFIIEFPLLAFAAGLFMSLLFAFLFSFTTTAFMCLIFFFVFYSYPSFVAGRKKKDIDTALPFATTYLATVASSGAPPSTMFRVLSQFEEYGEVAKEAKRVYRDVEAFGMNLLESLRKIAARTPSSQFKELLWGLATVLTAGSDPALYLHEKSKGFMQDHRRRLQEFAQTLSLLIEVYLTLLVLGSIFFIIMTSMMSMFGGGSSLMVVFLQFLDIFIIMPFVSVGFIFLLKFLSPAAM